MTDTTFACMHRRIALLLISTFVLVSTTNSLNSRTTLQGELNSLTQDILLLENDLSDLCNQLELAEDCNCDTQESSVWKLFEEKFIGNQQLTGPSQIELPDTSLNPLEASPAYMEGATLDEGFVIKEPLKEIIGVDWKELSDIGDLGDLEYASVGKNLEREDSGYSVQPVKRSNSLMKKVYKWWNKNPKTTSLDIDKDWVEISLHSRPQ